MDSTKNIKHGYQNSEPRIVILLKRMNGNDDEMLTLFMLVIRLARYVVLLLYLLSLLWGFGVTRKTSRQNLTCPIIIKQDWMINDGPFNNQVRKIFSLVILRQMIGKRMYLKHVIVRNRNCTSLKSAK